MGVAIGAVTLPFQQTHCDPFCGQLPQGALAGINLCSNGTEKQHLRAGSTYDCPWVRFMWLTVGKIAQTDQTRAWFGDNMLINSEISWQHRVRGRRLRIRAYSRDRHPFWQIE
ncbi:hypothetical protein [Mycolicibacterium sp. P9-22]|uniref:hypothetical protein n=1 Tax=Mycolicibacterium sp. P9-22 TaxID=2024613 RepID=UPI0011EF58FD|nr:hypothetical protein [Mycolicibacterium sp. P9-22]